MRSVRLSVFETNSSSTHSLVILSKKDFDRFCNNNGSENLFIADGKLFTLEEVWGKYLNGEYNLEEINKIELLKDSDPQQYEEQQLEFIIGTYDYDTYNTLLNNEYLECFKETFTTESGDQIVVFGNYGNDNY